MLDFHNIIFTRINFGRSEVAAAAERINNIPWRALCFSFLTWTFNIVNADEFIAVVFCISGILFPGTT